jgi:hypothetical protein
MRTLLALILFASVAVGQTIVEPKFIEWKLTNTPKVWLTIDTNMTARFSRDGGYRAIMLDRDTIWSKWWESIPSEPSDGMAVAEIDTNGYIYHNASLDSFAQHRADSVCAVRGHIESGLSGVTLLWCPPYTVDLPDRTLKIYWDRNTRSWSCARCKRGFSTPVQEKPDTVIIWRNK